jgi:hypothetical protein
MTTGLQFRDGFVTRGVSAGLWLLRYKPGKTQDFSNGQEVFIHFLANMYYIS